MSEKSNKAQGEFQDRQVLQGRRKLWEEAFSLFHQSMDVRYGHWPGQQSLAQINSSDRDDS